MRISFTFGADLREMQGKGASRRLRHTGKVPAILYGAHKDAQALVLDQQNLLTMIGDERFYSSIVRLKIGDATQEAIVKDVQMHPAKNVVVHVDLQRVVESEQIRIRLPIHFKGESISPGVKTEGGVVSHMRTDVEVTCLPKDLPEFLELDLSGMHLNETKFLADVPVPPGVAIPELAHRNARGGLDPRAACRGAGAGCRRGLPPRPPRVPPCRPPQVPRPGRLRGLPRRLPRAMPRRARRRRRPLPPRRKAARSSRRRNCDTRPPAAPEIPRAAGGVCGVSQRHARRAAQADRRARQPGHRVRAHASQRGLPVRRRAGAPLRRPPSAASRATAPSWRGRGWPMRTCGC